MGLDQAVRKLTTEVAAKIMMRQELGWSELADDERESFELTSEEYNSMEEVWVGRKENHIHKAVQDLLGVSMGNCDYLLLSKDQVKTLVYRLASVNENHSKALDLLPPQDGFFFGGTDINEWYFADIKRELEDFTKVLQEWDNDAEYAYWAWW